MENDKNVYERLWKLWAMVCKMIMDGVRDPEKVADALQAIVDQTKVYLRRIFEMESIAIGATDGTETLAKAGDVFTGYVDPDFKNWGLDVLGEVTEKQDVAIYELVEDGKFADIYKSVGDYTLDQLCLEQSQIKKFVVEHRDKLRDEGYATFFLFKVGDKFFVAFVYVRDDGRLIVSVYGFSRGSVWHAESGRRFVFPQ